MILLAMIGLFVAGVILGAVVTTYQERTYWRGLLDWSSFNYDKLADRIATCLASMICSPKVAAACCPDNPSTAPACSTRTSAGQLP